MRMLAETLQNLGASPLAWAVAVVLFLLALGALWRYRNSANLGETIEGDPAAARAYVDGHLAQGPAYLITMLAAIAAMIAGLGMVAKENHPEIGFFILIFGVVVVQVEPIRKRVQIGRARVIAASADDADRRATAVADLRDTHRRLVTTLFVLAASVALALLAF